MSHGDGSLGESCGSFDANACGPQTRARFNSNRRTDGMLDSGNHEIGDAGQKRLLVGVARDPGGARRVIKSGRANPMKNDDVTQCLFKQTWILIILVGCLLPDLN